MVLVEENVELGAGSSNFAGFLAQLKDVSTADMLRLVGGGSAHPQIPPPFPAAYNAGTSYIALDSGDKLSTWVLDVGIHYQCIRGSATDPNVGKTPAANPLYWKPRSQLRPYEVRIPGVRVLTERRPYSNNSSRPIETGGAGNTIVYDDSVAAGGVIATTIKKDSWAYVRLNSTGQGNFKKVLADSATDTVTFTTKLAPAVSNNNGRIHFLHDSHTIASIDAPTRKVTKTGDTLALPNDIVGMQVIFFGNELTVDARDGATNRLTTSAAHGLVGGERVRIAARQDATLPTGLFGGLDYYVLVHDADEIQLALSPGGPAVDFDNDGALGLGFILTFFSDAIYKIVERVDNESFKVERDLPAAPATMTGGFCILSGANSVQSVNGLAEPANSVLQDMTFYIDDNAPVYLTGLDYSNYDTTPFTCPRNSYTNGSTTVWGPTINLWPELMFQKRSRLNSVVLVHLCISASMISPFLNGQMIAPIQTLGGVGFGIGGGFMATLRSLDFHPSSPDSLYTALIHRIDVAKALLEAEQKTPRYSGLAINIWDNDPGDVQRIYLLRANTELFIRSIRAHVKNSSLAVSLSGPSHYGGNPSLRELLYDMGVQIAENDANFALCDTRVNTEVTGGYFISPEDFSLDGVHFSAAGQTKLAQIHHNGWDTVQSTNALDVQLAICNMAMLHIGDKGKIEALDGTDGSAQASYCVEFFPRVVKTLLEHPWTFNTRRKDLVLVTSQLPGVNPAVSLLTRNVEWRFIYALPTLPSNFGGALAVLPQGAAQDAISEPFEKESDLNGKTIILTDVENAVLRYTVTVLNPRMWSESFIMAASLMLASLVVGPLQKSAEAFVMAQQLDRRMQTYLGSMTPAKQLDAKQRKTSEAVRQPRAPWLRGGGRGV